LHDPLRLHGHSSMVILARGNSARIAQVTGPSYPFTVLDLFLETCMSHSIFRNSVNGWSNSSISRHNGPILDGRGKIQKGNTEKETTKSAMPSQVHHRELYRM